MNLDWSLSVSWQVIIWKYPKRFGLDDLYPSSLTLLTMVHSMQFCLTNCNKKSQYDLQQQLEDLWCWTSLHLCSEHPVVWLTSDSQNKLHLCHFAICCIRFWRVNSLENHMSYILLRTLIFQLHSCSCLLAYFLESGCFDITNLLIFHTLYHANDSVFLCISCFLDSIVKADCGMALGFLEKLTCFMKQNICFT